MGTTLINTDAAIAVADILGHEALCTLRLALRQAAQRDKIGNQADFKILYRRLGGWANLDAECADGRQ